MRDQSPSSLKQKILLLLFGGIALGLARTPQRQLRIVKGVFKEWQEIDRRKLSYEIRQLYQSKLVKVQRNADGSQTFVLTDKGKLKALTYRFKTMELKKGVWDGKWRVVIFDIPEKLRVGRDALREKLQKLGFYEFQKSALVFPGECKEEVEFIIEYFNLRKYVRLGVLSEIDNDLHLRQIFHLN